MCSFSVMSNGVTVRSVRWRVVVSPLKRLKLLPCICRNKSSSLDATYSMRCCDSASSLGGDRAHQGRGVVLHLFLHHVVHFAAAQHDRMGCSGVGSGGHG